MLFTLSSLFQALEVKVNQLIKTHVPILTVVMITIIKVITKHNYIVLLSFRTSRIYVQLQRHFVRITEFFKINFIINFSALSKLSKIAFEFLL